MAILLLPLTTLHAQAGDRITERAIFEDASGTLDFQQIQAQSFTPFSGILSRGYSQSALWVRLHIEPEAGDADESLILRIRPGYLDEVRMFDPVYHSLGTEVTGDGVPIARDEYRSLNSNLIIRQGDRPREIWLRIVSSSSRLFAVQALNQTEALHEDRVQEIPYGVFLAVIGLLALWGGVHWGIRPDLLMGLFTLKEIAAFFYMAGYLGYARLIWPTAVPQINAGDYTDWLLPAYTSLGCLFDYFLLRSFQAHPLGLRVLRGLVGVFLFEYALLLMDKPQQAFMLNGAGVLFGICLTFLLSLSSPAPSALRPGERLPLSRRSLIVVYTTILAGFILSVLPLLGLTQASFLVFDGFLIHGLVSGLAMLVLMMRRSRESERRLSAAEAARECAERHAETEQQQRQEQARFLTMLTHELKTPLAVVRMVLGSRMPTEAMKGEAERSIVDMHNIIQRCMQVERLVEPIDIDRRRYCCIVEELNDLIRGVGQTHRVRLLTVDLPAIKTDTMLLRMIVANLIDNAIKYGGEGSSVTLSMTVSSVDDQPWVCVRVVNLPGKTGWPDPQRLFQKFYRASHAHEHTGSGLGLFLSAQLARQLGGELRYAPTESEIGFELWVPA
jgi:signal transduction histidine kinase